MVEDHTSLQGSLFTRSFYSLLLRYKSRKEYCFQCLRRAQLDSLLSNPPAPITPYTLLELFLWADSSVIIADMCGRSSYYRFLKRRQPSS